jgi:hypothetical protein
MQKTVLKRYCGWDGSSFFLPVWLGGPHLDEGAMCQRGKRGLAAVESEKNAGVRVILNQ